MRSYEGKVVAVTGFASGIGAAVAHALVREGATVHGLDRMEPDPSGATFVPVDLADPVSIARAADAVGPVDALFNCAGIAPTRPALDVVAVNFLGMRELTERLATRMPTGAAIACISSIGGFRWRDRLPLLREFTATSGFADGIDWARARLDAIGQAYSFSKEATTVWTMEQSARLIERGIRINCTSPGSVQTPMLDEIERDLPGAAVDAVAKQIGRRSSPEEQATVLLFLNSDAAAYVNGVDISVDGGFAASLALAG